MSDTTPHQSHSMQRRSHDRIGVRTAVTTIAADESDTPRVYKAWTDDISPSGARLVCDQPIDATELCLRVVLPSLKDRLIMCRVVRRDEIALKSLDNRERTRYVYGVQFVGLHDCDDVDAYLAEINEAIAKQNQEKETTAKPSRLQFIPSIFR